MFIFKNAELPCFSAFFSWCLLGDYIVRSSGLRCRASSGKTLKRREYLKRPAEQLVVVRCQAGVMIDDLRVPGLQLKPLCAPALFGLPVYREAGILDAFASKESRPSSTSIAHGS